MTSWWHGIARDDVRTSRLIVLMPRRVSLRSYKDAWKFLGKTKGGWNGYARNYDPSIIGRFYILLPFASFTLSRLLLCWLVKSIGGSSHFVIFLGILEAFARHRNPLLSSSLFERQTSDPLQWKCLTKAGCVETKLLTKLPAAPTKLRNCEDREAFQFNGISIGLFGLFKSPRRMIGPCIPCHFATAFIMFHHVSSELDFFVAKPWPEVTVTWLLLNKCWCARFFLCQETLLRAGVQDQAPSGGWSIFFKCTFWLA